jgi:hypothetical protein
MGAIVLQSFVSLMLVGSAVALYLYVHHSRTFEHSDRLSLLPLDEPAKQISEPNDRAQKDVS